MNSNLVNFISYLISFVLICFLGIHLTKSKNTEAVKVKLTPQILKQRTENKLKRVTPKSEISALKTLILPAPPPSLNLTATIKNDAAIIENSNARPQNLREKKEQKIIKPDLKKIEKIKASLEPEPRKHIFNKVALIPTSEDEKILMVKSLRPTNKIKKNLGQIKPLQKEPTIKKYSQTTHTQSKKIKFPKSTKAIDAAEIKQTFRTFKKKTPHKIIKTSGKGVLNSGRVLLRKLEHGSAPSIRFGWPEKASNRDRLFQLLTGCYGMKVALMDTHNKLFRAEDNPGVAWQLNMDAYSGFIRLVDGVSTDQELSIINQVRERHRLLMLSQPIRMFPRNFDGALLGELSNYFNSKNKTIKTITGDYKQNGNSVYIENIHVNGHPLNHIISLAPYSTCRGSERRI